MRIATLNDRLAIITDAGAVDVDDQARFPEAASRGCQEVTVNHG
ncbi:MAG: hypothetical protein QOC63_387 [Mycobacterium sp.]|jgi:hypothetical protein|nr:hypothetical protein [Mycobacterium sp.]